MTEKQNGMRYAPRGKPQPVVEPGEFVFAAMALEHGHIVGMCNGLVEAGGELKTVFDPDPRKVEDFCKTFPQATAAADAEEILQDEDVRLVAAAAVPCQRGPLGCRVMSHGKDYFTDKTPFTALAQLHEAEAVANKTSRKYMVYYSERLHVESAVYAGQLIDGGAIGRVIQVIGLGPHRLNIGSRPDWFFRKEQYGGILCDIGSHQVEQFLAFAGASDAEVLHSKVANYSHPEHPELEDFGDAALAADNGATGYFRVDWFTPDGLSSWGDGRTFILGTEGYMELRKYVNVGVTSEGDHLFLVDGTGEKHMDVEGKVGFPFFGQLILDCLNRTENAMTQAHAFKAAEICLKAQEQAMRVGRVG